MTRRSHEEVLRLFRARRSVRVFRNENVRDPDLRAIVEAAALAPTARNIQPWEFVVIRDKDRLKALAALVAPNGALLGGAAAGIVVFCRDTKYYLEDGSAAITQALLAAAALGLATCWIAGDKKDYADRVRGFCKGSADLKLIGLIALGYAAEDPAPAKRPVDEMIHEETF
ncbi:MAG: nitroreductase family protein [Deltaproteobacteria bacterium]